MCTMSAKAKSEVSRGYLQLQLFFKTSASFPVKEFVTELQEEII